MRATIVTCLRNEGPFLLEWVAWQRMVGFTDVLIYTNQCEDGTDLLAGRLASLGHAQHISNDDWKRGPQWSMLKDAWSHEAIRSADWAMVADIDEFPLIHAGDGSLSSLILQAGEPDAICMPWQFFGSSGIARYEDRPVTEQFTRTGPGPVIFPAVTQLVKTLFRPSIAERLGVHAPRPLGASRWVNGSGRELGEEFNPKRAMVHPHMAGRDLVQLNHYALRSAESFLVKSERGLPNHRERDIDLNYWMRRNFNDTGDMRALSRLPSLLEHLDDLHADPELGRLHREAVRWHEETITRIRAKPEGCELYGSLLLSGSTVLPDTSSSVEHMRRLRAASLAAKELRNAQSREPDLAEAG